MGRTRTTTSPDRSPAVGGGEPRWRRMDSDERREQLLAVGLALFSTHSYEAVSVDDIAAASGASRGLLYHYFGSKRGLYVEVLRRSAAELIEVLRPTADEDPVAGLAAGLGRALRWLREHEAGYLTVLVGGIGADPEVQAIVEEVRDAIGALVLAAVPLPPTGRRLALAHLRGWVGYVEGLLPRLLRDEVTDDEVVDLAMRALRAGLTR